MTNPDKDPLSHAQELENIVDQLGEKVASEREAEGVPGKPSDREHPATRGSDKRAAGLGPGYERPTSRWALVAMSTCETRVQP